MPRDHLPAAARGAGTPRPGISLTARLARRDDADAIATIYNEGIADRIATFGSAPRTAVQIAGWFDGYHPIMVVEDEHQSVVAFAPSSSYRARACYAGVAECSVYVARRCPGHGAGRVAMMALLDAAAEAGKLVSRIFPENVASRALMVRMGFREVGIYQRHGKLNNKWRDCVIVERLLGEVET